MLIKQTIYWVYLGVGNYNTASRRLDLTAQARWLVIYFRRLQKSNNSRPSTKKCGTDGEGQSLVAVAVALAAFNTWYDDVCIEFLVAIVSS